jgi:2-succinyl-5-enolpyruvyl-6-hydroxy-3-cyclohexene-1-carboxylate synthase
MIFEDNLSFTGFLLKKLYNFGVRDFVYCSGARNAPIIESLQNFQAENINLYNFFEERSAGFFALGLAKKSKKAVAVFTTSGTAAVELYPAVVEAYYSQTPIVVVTADRPKYFRGSGAPQSIEQKDLFSNYVASSYDFDINDIIDFQISQTVSTHLNICFDEPLLAKKQKDVKLLNIEKDSEIVIVSELKNESEIKFVKEFLVGSDLLFYLESPSQLRETLSSLKNNLRYPEAISKLIEKGKISRILKIGGVPTLKAWRELETSEIEVECFTNSCFSGLARQKNVKPLNSLLNCFYTKNNNLEISQKNLDLKVNKILFNHPLSEPNWINQISKSMCFDSQIFIANSMVIRNWDGFAQIEKAYYKILVNRGVNGIDGIVSTFMGALDCERENYLVIGDLSALYDIIGLWPFLKEQKDISFKIIVINNFGGKIFSRVFAKDYYENQHELNFKFWANMFGMSYVCWQKIEDVNFKKLDKQVIVEINPCNNQTEQFWSEYKELWKNHEL